MIVGGFSFFAGKRGIAGRVKRSASGMWISLLFLVLLLLGIWVCVAVRELTTAHRNVQSQSAVIYTASFMT